MLDLLTGGWSTIILGGLVMTAFGGLYFFVRRAGAKAEREKQRQREAKARTISDDIDDAVAGRAPETNRERLKAWKSKP